MAGNNPNQNSSLDENRARKPAKPFPGMRGAKKAASNEDRSTLEVIDARKRNARDTVEEKRGYEEKLAEGGRPKPAKNKGFRTGSVKRKRVE